MSSCGILFLSGGRNTDRDKVPEAEGNKQEEDMKKMVNTAMFVAVVVMAFVGCQNPVNPPIPDPDPVKMPAGTLSADYEKIIGTGTIDNGTAIYRWDYNADGIADTGLFVEIGSVEKVVTLDNAEWIITVGGEKYLNAARMNGTTSWSWTTNSNYVLTFVRNVSSAIVARKTYLDNHVDFDYSNWGSWTYNADDSITVTNEVGNWNKKL